MALSSPNSENKIDRPSNGSNGTEFKSFKRILGDKTHLETEFKGHAVRINLLPDDTIEINSFSLDRVHAWFCLTPNGVESKAEIPANGMMELIGEKSEKTSVPLPFNLLELLLELRKK